MALNKNYNELPKNKYWKRCGKNGTFLHCWWEYKLVQSLWKIVWRFLRKLKIELPYDPAIPFLDIWLEETQPEWIHASPVFIVALFTITKT